MSHGSVLILKVSVARMGAYTSSVAYSGFPEKEVCGGGGGGGNHRVAK